MKTYEAVIKRIKEVSKSRDMTICDICLKAGMSPSNIYAIIKGRTILPKIDTIKRFCEGAGLTLREFFEPEYFNYRDDD